MRLLELTPEQWNPYEKGPQGFWQSDRAANPVLDPWHKFAFWGARLFGLENDGEVVSFCAAKFYKRRPEVKIYLNYTPMKHRGRGYAQELKRQFFDLARSNGYQCVIVSCQTPAGEGLYGDGVVVGTDKHGSTIKSYTLAKQ